MGKIKCGFAQDIITPELNGTFMDGYGSRLTPAEGIHDDLHVKVCTISGGDKSFVITSFEACGFSPEIYEIIRFHIHYKNSSRLSPDEITVSNTHTHAGPACGTLADLPINYDYWHGVGEIAGNAVKRAFESESLGSFDFSISGELKHNYNRRKRDVPVDRNIRTAGFYDQSGNLKGVLTNASCHCVVWKHMTISADYPSVLTKDAAGKFPGVPVLFLQGRAADINPFFEDSVTIEERYKILGQELSDGVLTTLAANKIINEYDYTLKYNYRKQIVPMKPLPSSDELSKKVTEYADLYYNSSGATKHYNLRFLNWHKKMLDLAKNGEPPHIIVPIQIMTLSNKIAFVMIPFELLSLTGHKIENRLIEMGFAKESIFVIGYANSVNGYLAPKEEIKYGGYEVSSSAYWYDTPECGSQSETVVLDTVFELFSEIL